MNGAATLTPLRTNHARLRNHERTGPLLHAKDVSGLTADEIARRAG